MPHGESWFSLLPFHESFRHAVAGIFGQPFNDEGLTWYGHQPIGVQHIYGGLLVLMIIAVIGVATDTSIRDSKDDLAPPDKLTVRNFAELLVGAIYNMMCGMMDKKAARFFLPLIGTCAFFILFSNAMGLVPGFLPATNNLDTTVPCALVIFFTTHFYGVKKHGIKYVNQFLGPIRSWHPMAIVFMMLMFCIEVISHISRPVSLSIRLMANMTADHLVIATFLGLIPFLVPVPMLLLGTLIVVVQVLVFCLLSTVYISMALEGEH